MAVRGMGGAIGESAIRRNAALDGMEVFANGGGTGNADDATFERGSEMGEEFVLEGLGKGAELDLAGGGGAVEGIGNSAAGLAEIANEEIAQADARTGVVETDAAGAFETRVEVLELVGGGRVLEEEGRRGR